MPSMMMDDQAEKNKEKPAAWVDLHRRVWSGDAGDKHWTLPSSRRRKSKENQNENGKQNTGLASEVWLLGWREAKNAHAEMISDRRVVEQRGKNTKKREREVDAYGKSSYGEKPAVFNGENGGDDGSAGQGGKAPCSGLLRRSDGPG